MADIKLYDSNECQIESLVEIVKNMFGDIGILFGFD